MTKIRVSGRFRAVSQLFYLCREGKVFILRLESVQGLINILCSMSPRLLHDTRRICRDMLLDPPWNKTLEISNLKLIHLEQSQTMMQLTKTSKININDSAVNNDCHEPTHKSLVSYRGIVTSVDKHLPSVFTLDKTIKVRYDEDLIK